MLRKRIERQIEREREREREKERRQEKSERNISLLFFGNGSTGSKSLGEQDIGNGHAIVLLPSACRDMADAKKSLDSARKRAVARRYRDQVSARWALSRARIALRDALIALCSMPTCREIFARARTQPCVTRRSHFSRGSFQ